MEENMTCGGEHLIKSGLIVRRRPNAAQLSQLDQARGLLPLHPFPLPRDLILRSGQNNVEFLCLYCIWRYEYLEYFVLPVPTAPLSLIV